MVSASSISKAHPCPGNFRDKGEYMAFVAVGADSRCFGAGPDKGLRTDDFGRRDAAVRFISDFHTTLPFVPGASHSPISFAMAALLAMASFFVHAATLSPKSRMERYSLAAYASGFFAL